MHRKTPGQLDREIDRYLETREVPARFVDDRRNTGRSVHEQTEARRTAIGSRAVVTAHAGHTLVSVSSRDLDRAESVMRAVVDPVVGGTGVATSVGGSLVVAGGYEGRSAAVRALKEAGFSVTWR